MRRILDLNHPGTRHDLSSKENTICPTDDQPESNQRTPEWTERTFNIIISTFNNKNMLVDYYY